MAKEEKKNVGALDDEAIGNVSGGKGDSMEKRIPLNPLLSPVPGGNNPNADDPTILKDPNILKKFEEEIGPRIN